ncbi:MAG: hypothetical protein P4L85_27010 [Paludisphaera borealis]|uniref:hypothetical protein n=1 Tax=Paludisphaera borealis TaxID=1387353 RepID=UPI002842C8BE|nr:hypothetical protein [Paludisphaera borealis]MDR3623032.1 hypothetical protein [Paludisphaera borealis]
MSSVVTMRPAATLFHEEQYFDWRVYSLLGAIELAAGLSLLWWTYRAEPAGLMARAWNLEFALGIGAGLGLPLLLTVFVLHMTTEATPDVLTVWYGWVPIYRRSVTIADIRACEVVEYRPIADHGGWGVRAGRDGERVLTARGDRGVRLVLTDGGRLLVGSQRADELAEVLTRSLRTDMD